MARRRKRARGRCGGLRGLGRVPGCNVDAYCVTENVAGKKAVHECFGSRDEAGRLVSWFRGRGEPVSVEEVPCRSVNEYVSRYNTWERRSRL